MRVVLALIILGTLTSCVTGGIPNDEYTMAKAAYDAAVAHESAKFAPQLFYKAEKSFKKAELLYRERYYDEARAEFVRAQKLCERAETQARVKEFTSGDSSE
jgi:hypothetical protein